MNFVTCLILSVLIIHLTIYLVSLNDDLKHKHITYLFFPYLFFLRYKLKDKQLIKRLKNNGYYSNFKELYDSYSYNVYPRIIDYENASLLIAGSQIFIYLASTLSIIMHYFPPK